jgi:heterodisulfide reductase subunit B
VRYYSYFPGCSAESTGLGLGLSTEAIAAPLDMDLAELEDWNCCGSTPYGSLDEEESIVVAARDLALAGERGLDLVTPCSSCYVTLAEANRHLQENPEMLRQVNEALVVVKLKYEGNIRVRHIVDVLYNDVTPEYIASKMKRGLGGLRVAPYYGCQLVRPQLGLDDTEFPRTLDALVACLDAEAVDFPLKARCCGGSLTLSEEDRVLGMMHSLLRSAAENGAQCLVTACPLCQTNLDAYQGHVNAKFGTGYNIPVLYITQLIGLALGIEPKALGLDSSIVSPAGVLEYINNPPKKKKAEPVEEKG